MPVTFIKKTAATAAATPAAAPVAAPAAKPKPQGHCKPLAFDVADLHKPGRLRVGHLLTLFAVSHSTFYKYQAAGLIPKPDGHEFKRPFWFTSTVLPYFTGTKGAQ
jgi:hypothetical protein